MQKKATSGIMLTLLVISVLTLAFNIQPAKAEPRTWYVNDDGGADFTRIQDAINAASPGDVIYVYNGIYFENLIVRKDGLTLAGENKSNTIIDGGGNVVIDIYRNRVSVSGFTARNGGQSWYIILGSDILLNYAQYCNVSDNILSSSRRGIASFHGRHNSISGNTIFDTNQGVTLYYTLNETVTDNAISNGVQYESDPPYGVQLWGGYDNRVMGNAITKISYVGISLGEYARNNVIQDNTVSDIYGSGWERGIRLSDSHHNTIIGNTISNVSDIGIFLSHYNNAVVSNTITNSSCGIYLMEGSHDNTIKCNTISNSTGCGVLVFGFGNAIVDNVVEKGGISLNSYVDYACKTNIVSGNVVFDSVFAITVGEKCSDNIIERNTTSRSQIGILVLAGADNNKFALNEISNNGLGAIAFGSNGNAFLRNRIVHSEWQGLHLVQSNDSIVVGNYISNNYQGILLSMTENNTVYHNNFIDNTNQVYLYEEHDTKWDDDYPSGGNYWSDYTDIDLFSGPDQDELGSDGIWDHACVIDFENRDRYPFTEPWAPTIAATIDVDPNALNLRSQGQWITAYVELPEGYSAGEIDTSTIRLNSAIYVDPDAPTEIGDFDSDGVADMMVKFKKTEVVSNIEEGLRATDWRFANIEFTVKGRLCDGTRFTGAYTVKVIKGDANGDGTVDIIDLSMVAVSYGAFNGESHYNLEADLNQDSVIDVGDLAMVSIEYGAACP